MALPDAEIVLQAVVEVLIPDPNGKNAKPRPVLIIGFDDSDESVFRYCAISSTFEKPIPHDRIKLPHAQQHGGHPATGLFIESVAVCSWTGEAPKAAIVRKWGYVPTRTFNRVIECIEELAEDDR